MSIRDLAGEFRHGISVFGHLLISALESMSGHFLLCLFSPGVGLTIYMHVNGNSSTVPGVSCNSTSSVSSNCALHRALVDFNLDLPRLKGALPSGIVVAFLFFLSGVDFESG